MPLYHWHNNRSLKEELAVLMQRGFVRVEFGGNYQRSKDLLEDMSIVDDGSWLEEEVSGRGESRKVKG